MTDNLLNVSECKFYRDEVSFIGGETVTDVCSVWIWQRDYSGLEPSFKRFDAKLNDTGIKEIKDTLKEMCTRELTLKDKNMYEKWAKDLMDEIESIAEEKYPDVPYWLDTGNRYQCCMEMLAHFRKDL